MRIQPFAGQVVLHELQVAPADRWYLVRDDANSLAEHPDQRGKLAKGQLEASEIDVSYPTLRLRRRHDGTWNLQGLLADPWPGPWIETPPILIRNATLELIPDEESGMPLEYPATVASATINISLAIAAPSDASATVDQSARARQSSVT